MILDDKYAKTVLIPVRVRSGRLEPLDGGEMPAIRDGAVGHLVVAEYELKKKEEAARFNSSQHAPALPKGSQLLVPVGLDKGMPPELKEFLFHADKGQIGLGGPEGYVQIELREELKVQLRGSKPPRLVPVACFIPALDQEATSVNHAYTKVSERFEPDRLSHTGNVFNKVLFLNGKHWRPLKDLRLRIEYAALSRSEPSPADS